VFRIREGIITDTGSWVYVWLRPGLPAPVVYVGVTGLSPAVRTWLHLNHPEPEVGRIRARRPDSGTADFDVIAFRLPEGVSRGDAKVAVTAGLANAGLLGEDYVGDPPPADLPLDGLVDSILGAVKAAR
jgi:hypothetical protein